MSNTKLNQDSLFKRISVYEQVPLTNDVNLNKVLKHIEITVPEVLCRDIDSIFIGQYDFLKQKNLEAVYQDGAIYITNEQESDKTFLANLIHEIAHCVEESYPLDVYGDGLLESEFLAKRRTMFETLKSHKLNKYDLDVFLDPEYSPDFDSYLDQDIGYQKLHNLLQGLFVSPYAATSLREYFANAFEHCFTGNISRVKSISPAAYQKVMSLWQS